MSIFQEHSPFSSNIALVDSRDGKEYSYQWLWDESKRFVSSFPSEKSLLFAFLPNCPSLVAAYLGSVGAGHTICLCDPNTDISLKENLIRIYQPDYVLNAVASEEFFSDYEGVETTLADCRLFALAPSAKKEQQPITSELSLLLSTSGTTGSSKMVQLTKKNLDANASSIARYLELASDERPISSLPFFYSYGLSILNSHLSVGATIVLTSESVIRPEFWELFNQYECTSFGGVPMQYEMLARIGFLKKIKVPTLRQLTQAGGRLKDKHIRHFHQLSQEMGAEMFVMYGQTEATARISYLRLQEHPEKIGSVGKAIPDGFLFVKDEHEQLTTEPNIKGEVTYQGPNVMLGLAENRDDLATGDVLQGTLHTGDLGYFDEEGFLHLAGRSKRIAKVFGLRVNLDEVEKFLEKKCTVAAISKDDKIAIYCSTSELSGEEIRKSCADFFKINHNAFLVEMIEAIPTTPNGKIDYKALAEES